MLAVRAGFRGREEAVYLDQSASIPLGFVFQLADKLSPSDIADGFGKRVVLDHVLDGQTLDADHLVFANDACGEVVLVVPTLVSDTGMHAGDFETSFRSVFRSLLLPGMPSLSLSQGFLAFRIEPGVLDQRTRRECHQGGNAKVKTDHGGEHWQRFNRVLDQQGHEIAVGAILSDRDRTRFRIFGKLPVPVDIQRSRHFCQGELLGVPFECVGCIGSRLAVLFLFEGGIPGAALKEILECRVQMSQGLLNRHTGDIRKPGILFLESRKHGRKIVVGELHATFVSSRAGIQPPIVHETDTSERLSKDDPLLIGWIEPEFVRPLVLAHCLLAFLLPLEMFLYRSQDLSVKRAMILFSSLSYLFQQLRRKPDSERFHIVFHATILSLIWLHVNWLRPPDPSPKKGTRLLSLELKPQGFTARSR